MPITDLEELSLQCRRSIAAPYVREAVKCYNADATRASIVLIWTAVCFDIIQKIDILAHLGNASAAEMARKNEDARLSGNIAHALGFEREILQVAESTLNLISRDERLELDRIRNDRNKCAHPTLVDRAVPFSPSPELARCHIHCAVELLIKHEPIQGKEALARIIADIQSTHFPTEVEGAITWLSSGPLRNPRNSLVNSLVATLIDKSMHTFEFFLRMNVDAAIGALLVMFPELTRQTIAKVSGSTIRRLPDHQLMRAVITIRRIPFIWDTLPGDQQQRLISFASTLVSNDLLSIDIVADVAQLRSAAIKSLENYDPSYIHQIWYGHPSGQPPSIVVEYFFHKIMEMDEFLLYQSIEFALNYLEIFSIHQITSIATQLNKRLPSESTKEGQLLAAIVNRLKRDGMETQ